MRSLLGLGSTNNHSYASADQEFAALVTGNLPKFSTPSSSVELQSFSGHRSTIIPSRSVHSIDRNFESTPLVAQHQLRKSRSTMSIRKETPSLHALDLYYSHFSGLQVSGSP